jgi:hypothetical protein
VLVDCGQNDRNKSTVAPYSLRAKLAHPTVSLPLTWEARTAAVDAGSSQDLLVGPDATRSPGSARSTTCSRRARRHTAC